MRTVGNRHRTRLHSERLPDGDLTPRQRELVDAIQGCHALSDTYSAPERVDTTISVCSITIGMSKDAASAVIEVGLQRAERELARLQAYYKTYGASGFMPVSEPDDDVTSDAKTRKEALIAVMRYQSAQGRVMTRAGDRTVERDASNAYVLA